ncbi:MAG: AAA family ATPase [Scytolyngbya sp. HA4215-MV1]|jgi:exonuclease SbcC|nr:AAA family ATPase [Scytolyngbya sp. HA4215-MV1]
MIPIQLNLKNFLSYREATLDFRGLHTACICGANGAGKSSLLEAIAWVVWGQSRVNSEENIIHLGAEEAKVDFIFSSNQHLYRIIRIRHRVQGTSLEFQIGQEVEQEAEAFPCYSAPPLSLLPFRSLTEKTIRATQQRILQHLKLDYDTFVNSAYLRQGRADEFMLRRPVERKQILADLLKLGQYDELAERARERSRQFKAQMELLERNLASVQVQLQTGEVIAQEKATLESILINLQQQQAIDTAQLQVSQHDQRQRQTWQTQLTWQQQQQRTLGQDCQHLQQDLVLAQQQLQEVETLLHQGEAIVAGYQQFQSLQIEEEAQTAKFQSYQQLQTQRQQFQQQQSEQVTNLERQQQQFQAQLAALTQQMLEVQHTLSKGPDVEAALENLKQARLQLNHLDQLQAQVSPLLQRRQQLQTQIDRQSARLSARLEELQISANQLRTQQEQQPKLRQAAIAVADRIEVLEQQRLYQQQVREKGVERRNFMERLQENQREYEKQLAELDHKISMLKQEAAAHASTLVPDHLYPPCPLCDRPLDEQHWHLVLEKHQTQQQEILDQLWLIRDQLTTSEREIQVLRREYRELEAALGHYGSTLERRGQLQEQLQITESFQKALQQLTHEAAKIEQTLHTGNYATELQEELRSLNQTLQHLNYDEKNHALARGELDRWRWAEIKQAEIKQAQRKQAQLAEQQPHLATQIACLEQQLTALKADTQIGLADYDRRLMHLGYDLDHHATLRTNLRRMQSWQLRYQELVQAQQQYPLLQQRVITLSQTLETRWQNLHILNMEVGALVEQIEKTPDSAAEIERLEQQIQSRRQQLDNQLAQLGRLEQQLQQHSTLSTQHSALSTEFQTTQHQYRIYQELAQAFGKNGIQALMIENVLPQLEAETNRILSRLSGNQLHVQFLTQRASKTKTKLIRTDGKASAIPTLQASAKLIDTLDIEIADAQGTRPYETYSGGEAFRVNFSIRLALARLLAQRSGTALQMLIVDEGFGTQDQEGCDRLISAINAIAPDFACILTITHMPHFKEAFQARIEVCKTDQGSQLTLSM